MFDIKIISIFSVIVFLFIGCEEPTKAVVPDSSANKNTLNNPDLGGDIREIEDYWYNFEEAVESQFLYHNYYITGGSNTISSPTSLNPYRDTLLFRTFPGYTVEVDNEGTLPYDSTISYMLSLTESNYVCDGKYKFKLEWDGLTVASSGITKEITWTQTSWLTSSTILGFGEMSHTDYQQNNPSLNNNFVGLGKSGNPTRCVLDGNGEIGGTWNCVGAVIRFGDGIPGPSPRIASSMYLYIWKP